MADVAFLLDSSGSIGADNWPKILDFVKDIVKRFDIDPYHTQVGVITYGNQAGLNFDLKQYSSMDDILGAISAIEWKDQV